MPIQRVQWPPQKGRNCVKYSRYELLNGKVYCIKWMEILEELSLDNYFDMPLGGTCKQ